MHNSRHRCGIVASTLPGTPRITLVSLAALAACIALAGTGTLLRDQTTDHGGLEELLPPEHRSAIGSHVRLVLNDSAAADTWPQIVDQLGPQLPGHFPLAPPPAEARGWIDAHILYRIAPAQHAALAARLEPATMRAASAGIHARLASPLFGVGDESPRRDPLGLRALATEEPGFLRAGPGPIATASGDLLSADGRTLLLYLRTGWSATYLHAWVSAQLAARFAVDTGIEVSVLPITVNAAPTERSPLRLVDLLAAVFAASILVLALGLRRTRTALVLVGVVAVVSPLLVLLADGTGVLDTPVLLALLGLALALAPGVGAAGPGPSLRLALALAPLLLLPYPLWQRWAWVWATGLLLLAAAIRGLAPPLLRLCAARPPAQTLTAGMPARRHWPPLAALALCAALLALGTWSSRHAAELRHDLGAGDVALAAEFFAPSRVAELRATGTDEAAALTAAVDDAARLEALGPEVARRIDAPGSLLLGEAEASARQAALASLDLPGRIDLLRVALTEQGLRPDAFGEFIRALDPNRQPTPQAALAGPLAGWLATRLEHGDGKNESDGEDHGEIAALSRVVLAEALPVDLALPAGLHGPAVFAHDEARSRAARLGLVLAAATWLSAFLTWLAARSLALALTAALVGLSAQAGALALVVAAAGVALPFLLPALLLVGACAAELTGRRCSEPVPQDMHKAPVPGDMHKAPVPEDMQKAPVPGDMQNAPVPGDTPAPPAPATTTPRAAVALACQVAPALVLLASPEPAWRSFGLVLGFGGLLGFMLATHAAPTLCALLGRLTGEEARR